MATDFTVTKLFKAELWPVSRNRREPGFSPGGDLCSLSHALSLLCFLSSFPLLNILNKLLQTTFSWFGNGLFGQPWQQILDSFSKLAIFIQVHCGFLCPCTARSLLAQLLSFKCLICSFSPRQCELWIKQLHLLSCFVSLRMIKYVLRELLLCFCDSPQVWIPQSSREEMTEVTCDLLLRQDGTLSHFQVNGRPCSVTSLFLLDVS